MTIRTRVTLWYLGILVVSLLVMGGVLHYEWSEQLERMRKQNKEPEPAWVKLPKLSDRSLPKLDVPTTDSVPPKAVAPVPTVNGLDPVTEVDPLSVIEPVPVENDPEPTCEKLPKD